MSESLPKNMTPMLQQYTRVKQENPDCLVFFRLGDFYELFFEDAVQAAKTLSITLTSRGKNAGENIPMCGVPYHAADNYIGRLIEKGYKVAICEQTENPEEAKKRGGYKAIVDRKVVRILTPGTLTEDTFLSSHAHNFLMALLIIKQKFYATVADISTGQIFCTHNMLSFLPSLLSKYQPKEILIPNSLHAPFLQWEGSQEWKNIISIQPDARFDVLNAEQKLKQTYKVKSLEVYGSFLKEEIGTAGAILEYINLTQKTEGFSVLPLKKLNDAHNLYMDAATLRNLEITQTVSGSYQGSLHATLNKTRTAAGTRLFSTYLLNPSKQAVIINKRLDKVTAFVKDDTLCTAVRKPLKNFPDLERILTRLSYQRGGPRDLRAVAEALSILETLGDLQTQAPPLVYENFAFPTHITDLKTRLQKALQENLPMLAREGNFITASYDAALDQQLRLRDEGKRLIAALQAKYCAQTGINSLKIKHNNVLGYFVELTATHKGRIEDTLFIHRQTLANSVRYTTQELMELERSLYTAAEAALKRELEIFERFVTDILSVRDSLLRATNNVAKLDVYTSFAFLARTYNYHRPTVDESKHFHIEEGRHPVIEHFIQTHAQEPFIANTCKLDEPKYLWLLTGPNMAGKSTFLRQNALIAIMAQMGCYVPAKQAHIGCIDRIFSRVGAADDLARGHSTFMVEMIETSTIINQATEHSFIILDEVGRGTATHDGLAIATAVVEHIHNQIGCRTLFATHYHELTHLTNTLKGTACYTMAVKEWQSTIAFLHKVVPGTADHSYGLHVAALAGLPERLLERASSILSSLEKKKSKHIFVTDTCTSAPLLEYAERNKNLIKEYKEHPVITMLEKMNPDTMTPKEALDTLYTLHQQVKTFCASSSEE